MDSTPLHSIRRAAAYVVALAAAAVTLVPSQAQTPGTVLLNIRSAYVKDAQGNPFGQTDDSLVVFVADLNGDGIAHPTSSSFAPGSDDFVIGSLGTTFDTGGTAILGGINLFANSPLFSEGPTVETGDAFAMFWYPELSNNDFLGVDPDGWAALMPGETAYGAYNTAESVEDSGWTIPNPPSAEDFVVFSTEVPGVGTVDPSLLEARFVTNGVVVPEPSSTLLSLLGVSLLVLRRRRSA
jgi:hypothetical protein